MAVLVAGIPEVTYSTATLANTFNNPNVFSTPANDFYGRSIAMSGTKAVVSGHGENSPGGDIGYVYVYDLAGGTPTTPILTIVNPNNYSTSFGDGFGIALSMSPNYIAVGAQQEDTATATSSGVVYIFNASTGALVHTISNPNAYSTVASDFFGNTVAITDTYTVVGAYNEDSLGGTNTGVVYVFDTVSGALLHTFDNPDSVAPAAGDTFGYKVDISGTKIIASSRDDAGGGAAFIFDLASGTPTTPVHTLVNPNPFSTVTIDQFWAVAIDGNYAIVGARREDEVGSTDSGKAYIFDVSTGALLHTLDNPNGFSTSNGDLFGETVALDGNYAVVGASGEDDAGGAFSGKAYIFDVTTGTLIATLDNPNAFSTSANDSFGASVAISGSYVMAGAFFEDEAAGANSGVAYSFNLS